MPRTTADLVGGIIEVDPDISLDPFIAVANDLVTEICAPVTTYTSTRLELIERWLSAHFYSVRDPRTHWEGAGSVSQRTESTVGMNLSVTRHGQQAMLLDTNGGLALLNRTIDKGLIKGRKGVTWLGSDPVIEQDE